MKTLKDLEVKSVSMNEKFSEVNTDLLREEAIKWYHRSDGNKHKFIMEFFNLTEEELMDTQTLKDVGEKNGN